MAYTITLRCANNGGLVHITIPNVHVKPLPMAFPVLF